MPRVERYGPRRARTTPLPGARQQFAAETFESAGGRVAEAQGEFGAVVGRVGAQIVSDVFQRERERADQVFQVSALRQANDLEHQVLRDPENGILNKRGLAAMEAQDEVLARWDEQFGLIAANAKTDRQRRIVEQLRVQRRAEVERASATHASTQLRVHDDAEFEGLLVSSQQRGVTNAGNRRLVGEVTAEQEAAVRDYAARNGLGPAWTDVKLAEVRNRTWAGAITQNLANGNVRGAKVYFDEAKEAGLLTGETLARMTEAVKRGVTDAEGERAAAEIWLQLGPTGDRDAIELDRMEATARARFGDDVDGLKATIATLRSRKAGVDDARRERQNVRLSTIWDDVLAGKPYDEIRRLPEAVAAPEELLKVRDYLDREAATAESRAAAREGRAAAREQREFTREGRALQAEQRRERQLEIDGWSTYWELSRPEVLRGLHQGEIVSQLPTLGRGHVNRLLTEKEQLSRTDAALRAATIDDDLFKDIASEALDFNAYALAAPSTATGKEQRANLGKLRAAVEDEIAHRQVLAGGKLSRDDMRVAMREVVDAKVMLRDVGWWYRDEERLAAIVDPKDREAAYVPIDRVPDDVLEQGANFLRGEIPALARVPTAEIRARYGTRLERAYALRLLGATRAEIEAALRGE